MTHPREEDLALLAGGELPFWSRWRVNRHAKRCLQCRVDVGAFLGTSDWVRETGDALPGDIHWSRLAAEMKANIRVGLAAGECVGPVETVPQRLGLRVAAAVLASATLMIVSGWWLHLPRPTATPSVQAGAVVLEATRAGIELKEEDRALTLLHPETSAVMLSVSVQGSLRARFVDAETGQVTINNVYVQ